MCSFVCRLIRIVFEMIAKSANVYRKNEWKKNVRNETKNISVIEIFEAKHIRFVKHFVCALAAAC